MKKLSEDELHRELHDKIIGLGEKSIRKSYYPVLLQKLEELRQEIDVREQREQQLQSNFRNHALINELLKLSLEDIPLNTLLEQSLEKILSLDWLVSETAAAIFLLDDSGHLVRCASRWNIDYGMEPCQEVPLGECLCGMAAASGEVQFASEIDKRHSIRRPDMKQHGHYCLPICLGNECVGVLNLYLPDGHLHDPREEGFFASIAATLAGIIKRHRLSEAKEQFEKILLQTQKLEALGTLSGGIAHDFNNLLMPILGYAELALKDVEPGSQASGRIREVIKAAVRAKDLVKQILVLSHQDVNSKELLPLRLDQVIEEVLPLVRAAIPSTVDIQLQIRRYKSHVRVDATHIYQIVLNLCINAYHAMPESGGVITIGLRRTRLYEDDLKIRSSVLAAGDYQILEVKDNGCGMKQEILDRIFDPYFTTKKKGEGTGLGLAVVNGIVKGYGGMISVYSEPDLGSSFHIYLPCVEKAAIKTEQQIEVPVGDEHVLVVDDEPQVGKVTAESLETLGYRITLFTDSSAAFQAFRDAPESFDLVLTDLTMPKMTGLELGQQLRAIRLDIPMILCTGFSDKLNEQKARACGFQHYLVKPVTVQDLALAVREVLDTKDQKRSG